MAIKFGPPRIPESTSRSASAQVRLTRRTWNDIRTILLDSQRAIAAPFQVGGPKEVAPQEQQPDKNVQPDAQAPQVEVFTELATSIVTTRVFQNNDDTSENWVDVGERSESVFVAADGLKRFVFIVNP